MIFAPFQQSDEHSLAGRRREVEFFTALISRTLAGHGALVLLGGEAGVGKSRLAREVELLAERSGMLVLSGSCYDVPDQPPYGPWVEAFSRVGHTTPLPDIERLFADAAGRPSSERSEVQREVISTLSHQASTQPVLIVLEDLHWAERTSIELLRVLARETRRVPLLIVVTYRNDEMTRDDDLYRMLPSLVREAQAARIDLPRLDEAATAHIVSLHFQLDEYNQKLLSRHVFDRTHGNPLHAVELLFALKEAGKVWKTAEGWQVDPATFSDTAFPVPGLLRQVIESRLATIDPQARWLLDVASVAGIRFDMDLWRALSGMEDEEFATACALALNANVLEEVPGQHDIQFRHALVRDTLYTGVLLPERLSIHRMAAEYLSQRNADPDLVADHYALAGDPRATHWLIRSGNRAMQLYAPETADARFTRAIEIDQQSDQPSPEPFLGRGQARATLGRIGEALEDVARALDIARASGDRAAEWQALSSLGSLWAGRDNASARSFNEQALDLARSIDDREMVANSLNRISNWHLNDNEPTIAIRYAEDALATFQEIGDDAGEAATTRLLAMEYLVQGDLVASDRAFRSAIDRNRMRDDRYNLCSALTGLIYTSGTYTFHTEIPGPVTEREVTRISDEALAIATDSRWRSGEAYVHLALGSQRGVRGMYDDALRHTNAGLEIAAEIDHREWMALGHQILGRLHLDLFSLQPAEQHLEHSLLLADQVGAPLHRRLAASYLAHIDITRGNTAAALERLDPDADVEQPPGTVVGRKIWATRATVALSDGDPEHALALTDVLIATTINMREGTVVPLFGRLRGEALTMLRRYEEAEAQLQIALHSTRLFGFRAVEWRILAALGRLHQESQRGNDAEECFRAARAVTDELARHIPDDELRATFQKQIQLQIPAPPRLTRLQARKREYSGLTARQRDVARLIGRGSTNAEIAQELSISERTAESHVAAILKKLSFTSRSQIAGWAIERGLLSADTKGPNSERPANR